MLESITQRQTDSFRARVFHLDHGLTVVHQHLPVTPVVAVDVWVKAGAIAEPDGWTGMAHFLEHMIFKGTRNLPPGLFDHLIENRGGITNAATGHDHAHFYLCANADAIGDTLPLLAEILLQAGIPDEEFYREREVILEELRASRDDPDWLAYQTLCQGLYRVHPYGRSLLGDEASLARLTPNQMRCFHRAHYRPESMVVAIVGGIEEGDALAAIASAFGEFPAPGECPPALVEAEPPPIEIRRSRLHLPGLQHSRVLMGWTGPGIDRLEEAIGLDLLSVILAGGRCSRLVRLLREELRVVLDIGSDFSLQRDSSLFTLSAWLLPSRADEVEALVREQIAHLQYRPVTDEEARRAKRLLCNDFIFTTETPGQLAGLYGYYQTLEDASLSAAYPSILRDLQPSHLLHLARQYLSPERYAITVLQPREQD